MASAVSKHFDGEKFHSTSPMICSEFRRNRRFQSLTTESPFACASKIMRLGGAGFAADFSGHRRHPCFLVLLQKETDLCGVVAFSSRRTYDDRIQSKNSTIPVSLLSQLPSNRPVQARRRRFFQVGHLSSTPKFVVWTRTSLAFLLRRCVQDVVNS